MKKLFLLIIAIAFILMGCVTTNEPTATSVVDEPVVENQKTPEEIEAENRRAELLSNSISIEADNLNINGIIRGSSLEEMISLMEDVDTLTTIWFPPKEYDLSERPENGYYIYENVAFVVKAGAVDGLSIVSPKYSFNGLMVGDSSDMILSTMGEPTKQWELNVPIYYEYDMGTYFVVIEVEKRTGLIREIAFNGEASE